MYHHKNDFNIQIHQAKLINRDVMTTNGVVHTVEKLIKKGFMFNTFVISICFNLILLQQYKITKNKYRSNLKENKVI